MLQHESGYAVSKILQVLKHGVIMSELLVFSE